jgi:hypothetical protein
MEITGIIIQRFDDGNIAEGWTWSDTLGRMRQLGMALGPDRPDES